MKNEFIRHYLSALAYRTAVAIRAVPEDYPLFELGRESRRPIDILNHITRLMAYAIRCYRPSKPEDYSIHDWVTEVERFYNTLETLDRLLAEGAMPVTRTEEQLLQGPFADAMSHVGQLAMLRRFVGAPVPYENYMDAPIQVGRLRFPD